MSSIPVGTVECRDPKVCGGARFHYAATASACGATKSPMRAPANFASVPPSQKADPSCRVHGIEPGVEIGANALNGKQVAAGTLGVSAILGLCSCSTDTNAADPTISGGPTTQVEQTVSPSPSPSPSPAADFVVRTATEDDWSAYSDEYAYSAEPQGAGEQLIFDSYPDLWDQGVRALSPKMVPGYNFADPAVPGAVVQYIDGERYEGTISEPLGFRGQTASPESLPSDTVANRIAMINDIGSYPAANVGQGGYTMTINEKDPSGKGTALEVYQFIKNDQTKQLGSTMYFGDWKEAWAYAQSHGYSVPGMDRELYPGEVATVSALRTKGPNSTGMSMWVFDSSINDWALAVNYDE